MMKRIGLSIWFCLFFCGASWCIDKIETLPIKGAVITSSGRYAAVHHLEDGDPANPLLTIIKLNDANQIETIPFDLSAYHLYGQVIQGDMLYVRVSSKDYQQEEMRMYSLQNPDPTQPSQVIPARNYSIVIGERWAVLDGALYKRYGDGLLAKVKENLDYVPMLIVGDRGYEASENDKIRVLSLSDEGVSVTQTIPLAFPPFGNYSICAPLISDMIELNSGLWVTSTDICVDVTGYPPPDPYPTEIMNNYMKNIYPRGALIVIDPSITNPVVDYEDVNLDDTQKESADKIEAYRAFVILNQGEIRIWTRFRNEMRLVDRVPDSQSRDFTILGHYLLITKGYSIDVYDLNTLGSGVNQFLMAD